LTARRRVVEEMAERPICFILPSLGDTVSKDVKYCSMLQECKYLRLKFSQGPHCLFNWCLWIGVVQVD
jgi:hypothetical protein